jgi:hypothetical protein
VKNRCSELGASYVEGSLKYCNCDKCNGEVYKCETSAPPDTAAIETTTTTATTTTAETTTTSEEEGEDKTHGPTDENGGKPAETGESGLSNN